MNWVEADLGLTGDVIAIDQDWILTDAGELTGITENTALDVGQAHAGVASGFAGEELVVFGANGPVLTTRYDDCEPEAL